ncbi:MAG: hypothetical protein IJV82_01590 [Oscillospiraceae bacterium]|nr:hypothetical protein [Oscillospiraceae bacterium]
MMLKNITLILLAMLLSMPIKANAQQEEVPVYPGLVVDPTGMEIIDYDDYLIYIDNHSVPENFVEYSDVKDFGSFVKAVIFAYFNTYAYEMLDAKGYQIHLRINHNAFQIPENIDEKLLSLENAVDLWSLPSNEDGYILLEECLFEYSAGLLESVEWGADDISYRLTLTALPEKEHTGTETTLLERLLDLDSARETIHDLRRIAADNVDTIETDETEGDALCVVLYWAIPVVAVAAAGGVWFFLHRRKKKNSTESTPTE